MKDNTDNMVMRFLIFFLICWYNSNASATSYEDNPGYIAQGLSLGNPYEGSPYGNHQGSYDSLMKTTDAATEREIKRIERNISELRKQLREKVSECRGISDSSVRRVCNREMDRLRKTLEYNRRYIVEERKQDRKKRQLASQKDSKDLGMKLAIHDLKVKHRRKERECLEISESDSLKLCNSELADITRQIEQFNGAQFLRNYQKLR